MRVLPRADRCSLHGGNVGIGTTAPIFNLNTADQGTIATGTLRLQNTYIGTNANGGQYGIQLAGIDNNSNGHDLRIQGRTAAYGTFSDLVTVKNGGNLGHRYNESGCQT